MHDQQLLLTEATGPSYKRCLVPLQKYGTDWPKVQQAVGTKDLTQTKNYYSNSKTRLKLDMLPLALGAKLPKSSPRSKASSSPPAGSPLGSGPAAAVHGELQPLVQQRQGRSVSVTLVLSELQGMLITSRLHTHLYSNITSTLLAPLSMWLPASIAIVAGCTSICDLAASLSSEIGKGRHHPWGNRGSPNGVDGQQAAYQLTSR